MPLPGDKQTYPTNNRLNDNIAKKIVLHLYIKLVRKDRIHEDMALALSNNRDMRTHEDMDLVLQKNMTDLTAASKHLNQTKENTSTYETYETGAMIDVWSTETQWWIYSNSVEKQRHRHV